MRIPSPRPVGRGVLDVRRACILNHVVVVFMGKSAIPMPATIRLAGAVEQLIARGVLECRRGRAVEVAQRPAGLHLLRVGQEVGAAYRRAAAFVGLAVAVVVDAVAADLGDAGNDGVEATLCSVTAIRGARLAIVAVHGCAAALAAAANVTAGAGVCVIAGDGIGCVLAAFGDIAAIVGARIAVIANDWLAGSASPTAAGVAAGASRAIVARR